MRIFTFSFVILNPQVANLLPIGNQLVIFALIPLSPWDSDSLEQFITHIGQILLCGEEGGRKVIILEKISQRLFGRLYLVFKQWFPQWGKSNNDTLGRSETMKSFRVRVLCNGNELRLWSLLLWNDLFLDCLYNPPKEHQLTFILTFAGSFLYGNYKPKKEIFQHVLCGISKQLHPIS